MGALGPVCRRITPPLCSLGFRNTPLEMDIVLEKFKSYVAFENAFAKEQQEAPREEAPRDGAPTDAVVDVKAPEMDKLLEKFVATLQTKAGVLAANFLYDLLSGELDEALDNTLQGTPIKDVQWLRDECNLSSVWFNLVL